MRRVFLDDAAGGRPSLSALGIYILSSLRAPGNPSAPYHEGRIARALLSRARVRVARALEVKSEDVIFTSGATEANTLALLGTLRAYEALGRPAHTLHILIGPAEHASIRSAAELLAERGARVETLMPGMDGRIDPAVLRSCITPATVLVSVALVHGETGLTERMRELAHVVREREREYNTTIALHSDLTQAATTLPLTRARAGMPDLMTLDGGKLGAPRGSGVLITRYGIPLKSIMPGGGQERGRRGGTESVPHALSFAHAFCRAQARVQKTVRRASALRERLVRALRQVPDAVLLTPLAHSAPHIVLIAFPGHDSEYLRTLLDARGISVATKSACDEGEPISLGALAVSRDERLARSTLRVSFSHRTTHADMNRFVRALISALPLSRTVDTVVS